MRIAIYGGSFNPPHRGHRLAAETAARQLRPDRLLIVPDKLPPHKELAAESPAPEERLALCRLAFAGIPGAELCDLELRREGKSYTADTVEQLRDQYPAAELLLVMGSDMLLCFEEWYRFRYLLEQCTLAVFSRTEDDGEALRAQAQRLRENCGARVELLPHVPLETSSGEIRRLLPRRLGAELLDEGVYAEIIRRRWYGAQPELSWLRERAYALLDADRVAHVAGCESEAIRLAMRWGEDPDTAAEAGILHDITKRLPPAEQLNLCEKYGIMNDRAELASPSLLHAKTGAALARALFGVCDEVYSAIRWHTTGRPDMTRLEKILYLADYTEPTRDFPGVEVLRARCEEDLDAAMALALAMSLEEIRGRGREPYRDTVEAAAWYAER